jgi:HEAT repeat protein
MGGKVRKLAKRLKNKDPIVRRSAVRRLAEIGGEKAEILLMEALGDENSQVRMLAARSLGRLGSRRATSELISALKDINYHVRAAAAEALGEIGDEEALSYLIGFLTTDDEELLRALTQAINALLPSDRISPGETKQAIDRLEALSYSSDPHIRAGAVGALGKLGVTELAPRFLELLEDDELDVVRAALKGLANLGDKRVVPYAIRMLESGTLTGDAIEALAQIGDSRAIPTLISLLSDPGTEPMDRGKAAWALKEMRAVDSAEVLAKVLFGVEEDNFRTANIFDPGFRYLREQVTHALMDLDPEMLHDLLEEGMSSSDGWIRMLTVDVMCLVDTPRSRMLLMEALEDPIEDIRRAAEAELRRRASEES